MMPTTSETNAYNLLHRKVQRWVYLQGWPALRPIQEAAIRAFFETDDDLVIAAPTAGGKTEAAFLPICSRIVEEESRSIRVLCISPLKALINDQAQRLALLGKQLDIPVHAWHGDIPWSRKQQVIKEPRGILMITPESFEALLMRHGQKVRQLFSRLEWIVIDELHVFIPSERGKQVESLLHRLEIMLGRRIRRLGLSATLGDLEAAGQTLRPGGPFRILEQHGGSGKLLLQVKGIAEPTREEEDDLTALEQIARQVFQKMRGNDNLVFANSRQSVEILTNQLSRLCETHRLPPEFFPHHGNLSKEYREDVEARLKKGGQPTTAICTSTLELGIDIGKVHTVGQIGSPGAVSALRQRLGRSGRRDGISRLRIYQVDRASAVNSTLVDRLQTGLFRTVAMIKLLLEHWNEPHRSQSLHPSTFVHQVLAVIAQYGGASAQDLWRILCADTGPFRRIEQQQFIGMLRHLGELALIQQLPDGLIVLGPEGETITNHFSFFAVFQTPEEYRLEAHGRVLGSLPISDALFTQKTLVFAGKTWRIRDVDTQQKVITLEPSPRGKPPRFQGGGIAIHDRVTQKMRTCYEDPIPKYLDAKAGAMFRAGQRTYSDFGLAKTTLVQDGNRVVFLPWLGTKTLNTITLLLTMHGLEAYHDAPSIIIQGTRVELFKEIVASILAKAEWQPAMLVESVLNREVMKYDALVSKELLDQEIARRDIYLPEALSALQALCVRP